LYFSCKKDNNKNNKNDGIKAFLLIKKYVEGVKNRYDRDRNPVEGNARVARATRHAEQVAYFLDDVCNDMCGMLQKTNIPAVEDCWKTGWFTGKTESRVKQQQLNGI